MCTETVYSLSLSLLTILRLKIFKRKQEGFGKISKFFSGHVVGGTEVVEESDFPNGHAVLEPTTASTARLPREKMVYMAVKDTSQGQEDLSEQTLFLKHGNVKPLSSTFLM